MLAERVRVSQLLDIYGALLTTNQQRILKSYVQEDFSLGEIAEAEVVSRQAVHDTVKRGIQSLEGYEKVLKVSLYQEKQKKEIETILSFLSSEEAAKKKQGMERLRSFYELM